MSYKGQWVREKRAALRASGEYENSPYRGKKKEAGTKQDFTGKEAGTKRVFEATKERHFTVYFSDGTQKTVSAKDGNAARARFAKNKKKKVLKVAGVDE